MLIWGQEVTRGKTFFSIAFTEFSFLKQDWRLIECLWMSLPLTLHNDNQGQKLTPLNQETQTLICLDCLQLFRLHNWFDRQQLI